MLELIILIMISGVIALLKSPSFKGAAGEAKVRGVLSIVSVGGTCQRDFHNLVLPTPDGTTQIDHVILSTRGIFVIETKNMSGWIFGGERQREWTQVLYKKKYRFKNPIHQNYKHVKAVENLLGVDSGLIISVVVFVGKSKFKNRMPDNVVTLRKMSSFIRSYQDGVLSENEVMAYSSQLSNPDLKSRDRQREHIENIHALRNSPICSRCGREMVLRIAGRGANRGKKFCGCSGYPECRGTRSVDD